ncbi:20276_t:CDS:2, partial [Gigaspora rosea]
GETKIDIHIQDELNPEKDTQSIKDIKDNIPIKEGYKKTIKKKNKIIINKVRNNIAIYHSKNVNFGIEVELEVYEMFNSSQELDTDKLKISNAKEIQVKKDEHEAFKDYEGPAKLEEQN